MVSETSNRRSKRRQAHESHVRSSSGHHAWTPGPTHYYGPNIHSWSYAPAPPLVQPGYPGNYPPWVSPYPPGPLPGPPPTPPPGPFTPGYPPACYPHAASYQPPRRTSFPMAPGYYPPPPNPMAPEYYPPPPYPIPPRRASTHPSMPSASSTRPRKPTTNVGLEERPENATFRDQEELYRRLVSIFRPMVGVVARAVQTGLSLGDQPKVKFELYPLRLSQSKGKPVFELHSATLGPIFQVTLPSPGATEKQLEDVCDALRDQFARSENPWHRQAGYMFRISRRGLERGERRARRRYWTAPSCLYGMSAPGQRYVAQFVTLALEEIREFKHDYRDESDDDQTDLIDDMWADVREKCSSGFMEDDPYLSM
ncbi:hypothetical protein F4677DRAFT_464736 [Hypoxylon crocopeplum]|nr:hypothetical protein F4677DRAFT_464736 [Hypoxylon crocopeplum]